MEISGLYMKSGLKNVGIVFLMTDAQLPNESFLVLINDMLASGEVPDLFPDDEVENIIGGVRNEVKQSSRPALQQTFVDYIYLPANHLCYGVQKQDFPKL